MGMQVAVGFKDGIQFFYVILDKFKQACEMPITGKSCEALRYSRGGHHLAVGIGNVVILLNPYTLQFQKQLQQHMGIVKSLRWFQDDQMVVSTCSAGNIYGWNLFTQSKELEHLDKNVRHDQAFYDVNLDLLASFS